MAKKERQFPLVVIFGRTNVGKSTLFNCLTEKKQALVSSIEGTTRDSYVGRIDWRGHEFELVDTGGIMDLKVFTEKKKTGREAAGKADIDLKVQRQARDYLKRADLILFVIDGKSGILPQDKEMALALKKYADLKKTVYVINKMDRPNDRRDLSEFYKLGLGEPLAISSATGSGTGDLLDLVVSRLPKPEKGKKETEEEAREVLKACIIGRPNVGKSSLLNSLLGEERVIVSPIPHTTREPQDTLLGYKDKEISLIDTAGINKRGRQPIYKKEGKDFLERKGISKSLEALARADIALFVVDISAPFTNEDSKIMEEIIERRKSLVIIANKWDLIEERDTKRYTEFIRANFPYAAWAPIQFISAKTGEKVKKILDLILEINEQRKIELGDSVLNTFLMRLVKIHKPSKGKGVRHPHIHKFRQTRTDPPEFELRIGSKDDLHSSYVRFIENRLREKFGFLGTPIHIRVTKRKAAHGTPNR